MWLTRCEVAVKGLEDVPSDCKERMRLELRFGSGLEAGLQAVQRAGRAGGGG